ncbi:MAG: bifunctional 5,10-methylenetetrahydrofolate dehydrogenase/5,10-methenyltetrahydrofolate cyclohydrolase [Chloroflexota bacterium]|nr:bifunctional 5,10-methylenetetrahydrofolate dehydrogenase/5,10-methenyltetrahydrofolate cyclohydrolase [Chloroflexota bacterium]
MWAEVGRRAASFRARAGRPPGLAIVQTGDDPASAAYLRQIERAFGARDLIVARHQVGADDGIEGLRRLLARLASDETMHGVLVPQPLAPPFSLEAIFDGLPATKDVEGIHPLNAGALAQNRPAVVPSTPLAGMELLRAAGVDLAGRTAVVVGRSPIVGRPLALLLLGADATVVVCHSRTADLGRHIRQADVLCVAAGRPGLVRGDMVQPGAVVVDFGINAVGDRLVGDVDFDEVAAVAGALTPVPGGIGPITTSVLARNLLDLAERGG